MSPNEPDVISFGRRRAGANRIAWAVVAFLSAALAIAIIASVHYHGQVVALHRQARNAAQPAVSPTTSPTSAPSSGLTVSTTNVGLVRAGSLTGEVTFIADNSLGGMQTNVAIIAYLSGGRPHTRYTLTGGSCSGGPRHQWAGGVTDARGNAELVGPVRQISHGANYWLELNPAIRGFHPALAGDFASATGISAYRSGPPMCGT